MTQKILPATPRHKLHCQILKACHALELPIHFNRMGSKVFTNYQRVALIVLHLRSDKSLRRFVSELYESRWPSWLGLKEIPGKSTLHDWMKLFELHALRDLNRLLLNSEKPTIMAIDATGIESWQRSRHYEKRIGEAPMPYAKLDILVDTDTFLVHDHVLRMRPRHDVLGARTMLKRTKQHGILILGDKGYDSRELCHLAEEKGNRLFAPVRERARGRIYGRHRRENAKGHPQQGKRSLVESTIRSLKTRKRALRARLHYMKKREMAWHILTYNLELITRRINTLIKLLLQTIPDRARFSAL